MYAKFHSDGGGRGGGLGVERRGYDHLAGSLEYFFDILNVFSLMKIVIYLQFLSGHG